MTNATFVDRLEKTSRFSAILAVLGAAVVFAALWLSYSQLRTLQTEVNSLRQEIGGLREALTASRDAIIAFHQRDYNEAVALYDQALHADPNNAYLLNLKAYSLFKLKRFQEAIKVQKESIRIDPDYAWGFFDLARFQCATGDFNAARTSIGEALDKMKNDGEFQKLCAAILR
jgi:tetratricopeptide (TPR) repeat protein